MVGGGHFRDLLVVFLFQLQARNAVTFHGLFELKSCRITLRTGAGHLRPEITHGIFGRLSLGYRRRALLVASVEVLLEPGQLAVIVAPGDGGRLGRHHAALLKERLELFTLLLGIAEPCLHHAVGLGVTFHAACDQLLRLYAVFVQALLLGQRLRTKRLQLALGRNAACPDGRRLHLSRLHTDTCRRPRRHGLLRHAAGDSCQLQGQF